MNNPDATANSKRALVICAAAVLLPWVWGVWAMPPWMGAAAFLLSIASILLISRLFTRMQPAPAASMHESVLQAPEPERLDFDVTDTTPPPAAVVSAGNLVALQLLVAQWLEASRQAGDGISSAGRELHEVNQQSEAAAVNIGNSFRSIMDKTGHQMESAVRLLRSDSPAEGGGSSWLSLPDFIKAYEYQLDEVTKRMMDFSQASQEMSKHQDVVRQHSVSIDEMLDELRAMAARIRKLALDSTVAYSEQGNGDSRWFIEIADRIRETSNTAHELTRRIRDGLENIRAVMGNTYEELDKSSGRVRLAAVQAKVDVSQLNITTLEKAREVTRTLEGVNSLGEEIRREINSIIVGMQYQDITQQRLEHIRKLVLESASASLAGAYERTRHEVLNNPELMPVDVVQRLVESRNRNKDGVAAAPAGRGATQSVDIELF